MGAMKTEYQLFVSPSLVARDERLGGTGWGGGGAV